ncbi:hypothetical protein SMD44_08732 [Streptomyces alboflavus]|uniref:Uncharacterized protein n=1 Tax=Streptomyces alboflavus TaxID=67267 RepID=A0A1Z1WS39_9ACTN|nr:hypothetical protein [Streptomyces alboflavus]ARX89245.1 hypothetical protein SMD44_08732 [Streptomyces alboflavus]
MVDQASSGVRETCRVVRSTRRVLSRLSIWRRVRDRAGWLTPRAIAALGEGAFGVDRHEGAQMPQFDVCGVPASGPDGCRGPAPSIHNQEA